MSNETAKDYRLSSDDYAHVIVALGMMKAGCLKLSLAGDRDAARARKVAGEVDALMARMSATRSGKP
jgi:hypothetical protein